MADVPDYGDDRSGSGRCSDLQQPATGRRASDRFGAVQFPTAGRPQAMRRSRRPFQLSDTGFDESSDRCKRVTRESTSGSTSKASQLLVSCLPLRLQYLT